MQFHLEYNFLFTKIISEPLARLKGQKGYSSGKRDKIVEWKNKFMYILKS